MSAMSADESTLRRSTVLVVAAVVATALLAWATWALFLAPRKGTGTVDELAESLAADLRAGDFDAVRERLDPGFTLDPGGLDREAALAVARAEHDAGRLFPYVAFTHVVPGGTDDTEHFASLGVLAKGSPEKMRDVPLVAVRVEIKARKTHVGYRVVSARVRLGR